jgi:hypothetical protein
MHTHLQHQIIGLYVTIGVGVASQAFVVYVWVKARYAIRYADDPARLAQGILRETALDPVGGASECSCDVYLCSLHSSYTFSTTNLQLSSLHQ